MDTAVPNAAGNWNSTHFAHPPSSQLIGYFFLLVLRAVIRLLPTILSPLLAHSIHHCHHHRFGNANLEQRHRQRHRGISHAFALRLCKLRSAYKGINGHKGICRQGAAPPPPPSPSSGSPETKVRARHGLTPSSNWYSPSKLGSLMLSSAPSTVVARLFTSLVALPGSPPSVQRRFLEEGFLPTTCPSCGAVPVTTLTSRRIQCGHQLGPSHGVDRVPTYCPSCSRSGCC